MTKEAVERLLDFTSQRDRITMLTRDLAKGLAIVRKEHPNTDDEWRAKWLGGYLASLLLSTASSIERAERRATVERVFAELMPLIRLKDQPLALRILDAEAAR